MNQPGYWVRYTKLGTKKWKKKKKGVDSSKIFSYKNLRKSSSGFINSLSLCLYLGMFWVVLLGQDGEYSTVISELRDAKGLIRTLTAAGFCASWHCLQGHSYRSSKLSLHWLENEKYLKYLLFSATELPNESPYASTDFPNKEKTFYLININVNMPLRGEAIYPEKVDSQEGVSL